MELAKREIKEWTKFLKLAKEILEEEIPEGYYSHKVWVSSKPTELSTILKEADKEYDKIWSELGYKKSIPEFYHSQISKAYEAGRKEGRKNLLDECPDTQFLIGKAIAEERERIGKELTEELTNSLN